MPLIDALIEAGGDLDFQRDREDGKKSDTPLIGAASLGAGKAGLRLLDGGAKPELRGLFGETALHRAAFLGEIRLTAWLIEGSDINLKLKDKKYRSSPWLGTPSIRVLKHWAGALRFLDLCASKPTFRKYFRVERASSTDGLRLARSYLAVPKL